MAKLQSKSRRHSAGMMLVLLNIILNSLMSSSAFVPAPSRVLSIEKSGVPTFTRLSTPVRAISDDNDDEAEESEKEESKDTAKPTKYVATSDDDMTTFARQKTPRGVAMFAAVQQVVVAAGWTFLAFGIVLNIFGYDYVVNEEGRLTIDTMEASQFRQEVVKAAKQQQQSYTK